MLELTAPRPGETVNYRSRCCRRSLRCDPLLREKKDRGGLGALLPKPAAAAPLSVFPPGLATQTERATYTAASVGSTAGRRKREDGLRK